jgi:1,4-dihydroxy-2-naphthoate octaprenyltransferase
VSVLSNWIDALQTTNLPEGIEPDPVSRWLVVARASVIPMTIVSAAIGGLLAVPSGSASLATWLLCTLGLVLAHACNNLMNDWFDLEGGVDTPEYARALYAPHPILSGWVTKRELLGAIAICNGLGLAIALALTWLRGWPVVAFASAGFFLSVFYAAPPLRLKHHGLGEPSVFVIWGPLMIAGTYFVTAGSLPAWVWGASLPYGLLVATVLFGKHIDKLDVDSGKGIHTLPVLLGDPLARRVNQVLMVGFFASVAALVATGAFGVWTLLVFAATPRLVRVLGIYAKPAPTEPPPDYPIWPLWYVAAAFLVTRQAGALFALGLVLNAIWPLHL